MTDIVNITKKHIYFLMFISNKSYYHKVYSHPDRAVVDQTQLCSEFDLGHHQIGSLISNIPNRNFRFGISMSEM